MHTTKTVSAYQVAIASSTTTPWIVLFAVSALPLFMLQLSIVATLQTIALLSLTMVAFAHLSIANDKYFEAANLAIKLVAPLHFALMIWLSVYVGREIGGTSFAASYIASIACLAGIVILDAVIFAALALIAGSFRSVSGLSLVTLISTKYAGLLGKME